MRNVWILETTRRLKPTLYDCLIGEARKAGTLTTTPIKKETESLGKVTESLPRFVEISFSAEETTPAGVWQRPWLVNLQHEEGLHLYGAAEELINRTSYLGKRPLSAGSHEGTIQITDKLWIGIRQETGPTLVQFLRFREGGSSVDVILPDGVTLGEFAENLMGSFQ